MAPAREKGKTVTRGVLSAGEGPPSAPRRRSPAPGGPPSPLLTEAELAAAELWLEERVYERVAPRFRHPRVRMWFIFMLLRHAGLRLVEIFRLHGECLDFGSGLLRVPPGAEGTGREVPLAPAVVRKLGAVWASWEGRELALPFLCDASRVRRSLNRCALACGLAPELFNARELRRNRGLELAVAGIHPSLVDMFLGRDAAEKKSLVRFEADEAKRLLRERIQGHARTSARNHFRGRVIRVRHERLLADVTFATASGLEVQARITDRSCHAMGLGPGVVVCGAVKALWIEVRPAAADRTGNAVPNCFGGRLDTIRRVGGFAENLISLEDGAQVCAVRPVAEKEWLGEPGERVEIVFSPAAVILTVG